VDHALTRLCGQRALEHPKQPEPYRDPDHGERQLNEELCVPGQHRVVDDVPGQERIDL
jgi:hypothetical protein